MSPDDYLRQRLEHHLPDEQGKEELIALLLPLLSMGARQSAAIWQGLREEVAQAVAQSLKDDADRVIFKAWDEVLERGNQIVAIGEARRDFAIQALGTLVKADALKLKTGRLEEAWHLFEVAGELYRASPLSERDKAIGWARSRVGRVNICAELGLRQQAFEEAEQARQIFEQYEVWDRLFFLHYLWGSVCNTLYEFRTAHEHFLRALALAAKIGTDQSHYEHIVYNNLGVAERGLGRTKEALLHFQQAERWFSERGGVAMAATARFNQALGYIERGHYSRALQILFTVEPFLAEKYPELWLVVMRNLIECYMLLNRAKDAYHQGKRLLEQPSLGLTAFQRAHFARQVAGAAMACQAWDEGEHYFLEAHTLFQSQGVTALAALTNLERLHAIVLRGEAQKVMPELTRLIEYWQREESLFLGNSFIVAALAYHQMKEWARVRTYAGEAVRRTRRVGGITVQYQAHLLLGEAAESIGNRHQAKRHFRAGIAAMTRAQRGLTITLRPDFFGTREGGFQNALRLELEDNNAAEAFALLERWKLGTFAAYLNQQHPWQWERTPVTAPLLDELAGVRARHFALGQSVMEKGVHTPVGERLELERRMRTLTEALYVHASAEVGELAGRPTATDVQAALAPDTAILEYYDDGRRLWCVLISTERIELYCLADDSVGLGQRLTNIRENNRATSQSYLPEDRLSIVQAKKIRREYEVLGTALLEPVARQLGKWRQLIFVPYGNFHTLPFNLLRVNGGYLIEQVEVVTLPAAALLFQPSPVVAPGARWVGYSRNGTLLRAVEEVNSLYARWGGALHTDADATRTALAGGSCQLLHLSTHGVHRVDHHFDLSFLELADGALYGDDLLQMALQHELVTLSACDAGAAEAAPGGDMIGLGRAFLYAGVGALVASLWQVREEVTLGLMAAFYEHLFAGASKAEALRTAQLAVRRQYPSMHPVFWGAFQLVGNAAALSEPSVSFQGAEHGTLSARIPRTLSSA